MHGQMLRPEVRRTRIWLHFCSPWISQGELQALFNAYSGAAATAAAGTTPEAAAALADTKAKKRRKAVAKAKAKAVASAPSTPAPEDVESHQLQQALEPWRLPFALEPQWLHFADTGQVYCQARPRSSSEPPNQARSSRDNLPPGTHERRLGLAGAAGFPDLHESSPSSCWWMFRASFWGPLVLGSLYCRRVVAAWSWGEAREEADPMACVGSLRYVRLQGFAQLVVDWRRFLLPALLARWVAWPIPPPAAPAAVVIRRCNPHPGFRPAAHLEAHGD